MKKAIFILIVCSVPAVLFAQQKLLDVKAPDAPAETATVIAEEKVIVIEPAMVKAAPAAETPAAMPQKTAAPAGALKVMPAAGTVQKTGEGFKVLKRHKVVKGDTLWDLAARYYKDPFMWGRIYNANFSSISNPDLIYPKEEIIIPDISELLIPYRTPAVAVEETAQPAPASVSAPAPIDSPAPVRRAALPARTEGLKDADINSLSEVMPKDQKEWADNVKLVPDSWHEDGVVTAKLKNDDPFLEDGISSVGSMIEVSMDRAGMVRPGDYLIIYMRGAEVYGDDGVKQGNEVQLVGTSEVSSADGSTVKARVIDATSAIMKGYVVKKK